MDSLSTSPLRREEKWKTLSAFSLSFRKLLCLRSRSSHQGRVEDGQERGSAFKYTASKNDVLEGQESMLSSFCRNDGMTRSGETCKVPLSSGFLSSTLKRLLCSLLQTYEQQFSKSHCKLRAIIFMSTNFIRANTNSVQTLRFASAGEFQLLANEPGKEGEIPAAHSTLTLHSFFYPPPLPHPICPAHHLIHQTERERREQFVMRGHFDFSLNEVFPILKRTLTRFFYRETTRDSVQDESQSGEGEGKRVSRYREREERPGWSGLETVLRGRVNALEKGI